MRKYLSVALILSMLSVCVVFSVFHVDHMLSSMLHLMYQNEDYVRTIQPFEGEVVFEFDWDDPESNIGKEIFDDGQCSISIAEVQDDKNGGFDIYFRAHGYFNGFNGRLITACSHADGELFHSGKLTVLLGDNVYINDGLYGMGILARNDGDDFIFHAFPLECYEQGELIVADQIKANGNVVTMKLTDLYEVTWTPINK